MRIHTHTHTCTHIWAEWHDITQLFPYLVFPFPRCGAKVAK